MTRANSSMSKSSKAEQRFVSASECTISGSGVNAWQLPSLAVCLPSVQVDDTAGRQGQIAQW